MWVDSTLRGLIEALSRLLHRGSVRSTFARLQQVRVCARTSQQNACASLRFFISAQNSRRVPPS